jgi:glycosyltransferase involved in cell wall biosynthesis
MVLVIVFRYLVADRLAGGAMRPRFSVVVPCYNEASYIADTLRSLHEQTYSGEYEIIVVDNNCTDDTAHVAARLGARVVVEPRPGVCNARQRGTEASTGEIVISADADTRYAPDWLAKIDSQFRSDDQVVAVVGPCRYRDGPLWGRLYARLLFGTVHAWYLLTRRVWYVTATNIAFRRDRWPGYNTTLTQGGDELDLLRNLRRRGRMVFDSNNPTFTSGRRLTRGLAYNAIVTLLVFYLLAYFVNRLLGRRVLGSAPAYRDSLRPQMRYLQAAAMAVLGTLVIAFPFAMPRHYIVHESQVIFAHVISVFDSDGQ